MAAVAVNGMRNGRAVGNGSTAREKDDRDIWMPAIGKEKQLSIGWTIAYYLVLVGGAVFWWQGLWKMTEYEGALVDFSVPGRR